MCSNLGCKAYLQWVLAHVMNKNGNQPNIVQFLRFFLPWDYYSYWIHLRSKTSAAGIASFFTIDNEIQPTFPTLCRSRFQHNVLKLDEQIVHHHKLHKALESELLNAHEENRQHLMNIQEAKRTLGMILSAFRLIANADQGSKPGAEDDIVNKAKDVQCRMGVMYSRLETEVRSPQDLQPSHTHDWKAAERPS